MNYVGHGGNKNVGALAGKPAQEFVKLAAPFAFIFCVEIAHHPFEQRLLVIGKRCLWQFVNLFKGCL